MRPIRKSEWDLQALDPGLLQLADVPRGDPPTGLDDDLLAELHVEPDGLTAQPLRDQGERHLDTLKPEGIGLEKALQDVLDPIAQCAQQDGCRQLAAAVDTDEDVVLRIEFEVQPGPAVGDHPRREQELAGGMGLALVVIEKDARRAMQLGDDDPLSAVDDEGAGLRHERQFAHVNLLLLDILDHLGAGRGLLVVDHQAQQHPQGRRVGRAAQVALTHVKGRLPEPIADILQHRVAGIALDRKHGLEGRMQPRVQTLLRRQVSLQELAIGLDLGGQEEGDVQDRRTLAEVFTDALFFGERISHYAFPRDRTWDRNGTRKLDHQRFEVRRPAAATASPLPQPADHPHPASERPPSNKRQKAGGLSPPA